MEEEVYDVFFLFIAIAGISSLVVRGYRVVPPSLNRSVSPPSIKMVPLVRGLIFGAGGILWGGICARIDLPDNWIGVLIFALPLVFLAVRGSFYLLEGLGWLEKLSR